MLPGSGDAGVEQHGVLQTILERVSDGVTFLNYKSAAKYHGWCFRVLPALDWLAQADSVAGAMANAYAGYEDPEFCIGFCSNLT